MVCSGGASSPMKALNSKTPESSPESEEPVLLSSETISPSTNHNKTLVALCNSHEQIVQTFKQQTSPNVPPSMSNPITQEISSHKTQIATASQAITIPSSTSPKKTSSTSTNSSAITTQTKKFSKKKISSLHKKSNNAQYSVQTKTKPPSGPMSPTLKICVKSKMWLLLHGSKRVEHKELSGMLSMGKCKKQAFPMMDFGLIKP